MRALLYFISVLAQDEETQRKGCVLVLFNMHPFRRPMGPPPAAAIHSAHLIKLSPIRYVGLHLCYDDPHQTMSSNLAILLSSSADQFNCARTRVHSGTSKKKLWICFNVNINLLFYALLQVHYWKSITN